MATTTVSKPPDKIASTTVFVLEEVCSRTRITLMDHEFATREAAVDEAAHRILLNPAAFRNGGPILLVINEVTR